MVCKFFPYEDSEVEDMQMAWETKCRGSSAWSYSSVTMVYPTSGHGMDCIARYHAWVASDPLAHDNPSET